MDMYPFINVGWLTTDPKKVVDEAIQTVEADIDRHQAIELRDLQLRRAARRQTGHPSVPAQDSFIGDGGVYERTPARAQMSTGTSTTAYAGTERMESGNRVKPPVFLSFPPPNKTDNKEGSFQEDAYDETSSEASIQNLLTACTSSTLMILTVCS
jgi:hypothetical protein